MESKRIPISVAARLIYQLGEQLISDELVAVLELVKNAYDADATKCSVTIDNDAVTEHGLGRITISDNGNGMLPHTVENDFLRLSTNYKKVNKITPYYRRQSLGEKGLGRLSFQRLGKYIDVKTTPRIDRLEDYVTKDDKAFISRNDNTIHITMDWEGFADEDDIDKVFATVSVEDNPSMRGGTIIEISGIRNPGFWELNKTKRKRLHDEILALINPFEEAKNQESFYLIMDVNGETFMVDAIDEKIIDQLSDISCNYEFDGHNITINALFKDKYINSLKEKYIRSLSKKGFELLEDNVQIENKKDLCFSLDDICVWKETFKIDPAIIGLIDQKPALDFTFSGGMYIVDKDRANKTEIDKEIRFSSDLIRENFFTIGKLWDSINGVFVYRDQFRILPYGKNDWLGLTVLSQKTKATVLKQGNVCGFVKLPGESSENIREQTNRQGIIEDEYGTNFLLIMNDIITRQLFRWDTAIRAEFLAPKYDEEDKKFWNPKRTISFKHNDSVKKDYEKTNEKLQQVINESGNDSQQISWDENEKLRGRLETLTEAVEDYRTAANELQKNYQRQLAIADNRIEELQEVIPMLGQSMIIEVATHELNRVYSNMAQSSKTLLELVDLLGLHNKDLRSCIFDINNEISDLSLQLNHILPTQRYKLKDIDTIDVKSFLLAQYVDKSAITKRLNEKGIKTSVEGETFSVNASKGNLIVVFDNLILNSEYWLERSSIDEKAICFECFDESTVRVWDSGKGVDPDIEKTLFEPFQTMKKDGRGLGLYIVQELLALMGASIRLLDDRNANGNRYIFEIVFNKL